MQGDTIEGMSRRELLQTGLSGLGALVLAAELEGQETKKIITANEDLPILKKNRISWDKMKELYTQFQKLDDKSKQAAAPAYNKTISQYFNQVLTEEYPLVYDPKKNPKGMDGILGKWYLWSNEKQRAEAEKHIRKEHTAGPASAEKFITDRKVGDFSVCCVVSGEVGFDFPAREKRGFLLINDSILKYEKEEDFFSNLIRFQAYARAHELNDFGLRMQEEALNAIKRYPAYNHQLIAFYARTVELDKMLSGRINASSTCRNITTNTYLQLYSGCTTFVSSLRKEGEQNKNTIPLQAAEFIQTIMDGAATRCRALGYEHKQVEGKWVLEKVSGANGSQNK